MFERLALAAAESLAGRLLAGEGPVILPAIPDPSVSSRRARLGVDAFGTTSPELREKLSRVLDGDGVIVTTGQQPLLFLGPLYVIYKALTAIEVARGIEREFGVAAVPVFWVASDDHDWDEVGQTTIVSTEGESRTLRLSPPAGMELRPTGPTALPDSSLELVDELSELVPQSEFIPYYLDQLRGSYAPGVTVSEAFARTLAGVLEGHEYAWLDAADPELKTASIDFFDGIFHDPSAVLEAMAAGDRAVRSEGYEPLIAPMDDGLPIFHDDGTARQRIRSVSGGFAAGRDGPVEPAAIWSDRLRASPERFSPNVSARPALESWLMPVCCTVLGPGEVAYWSQLGPVFEALSVPFPTVVPRSSFVAVEPRTRKVLDQLDLEIGDLEDGGEAVERRVTAEGRPESVDAAIASLRASLGERTSALTAAIAAELPGLKGASGKATKALFDAVQEMDRQVDAAVRERQDIVISKIERAASVLWPDRQRQERKLSPYYFLARYGRRTIGNAREAIAEDVASFLAGSGDGR